MEKYIIMRVDDEREVLDSVAADLEYFGEKFDFELCESAIEAGEIVEECLSEDRKIALILCDHVMPNKQGVDFLVELNESEETAPIKKILLTGQAGLEATIQAVNDGGLNHYISKPWERSKMLEVVKKHLTDFIIENDENMSDYTDTLDSERIFQAIYQNN